MSNITQGVKYSLVTRQLSSHVKLTHRSRAAVLDDILWHVPKNAAVVYCLENFCNNCNTKAIIKKKNKKRKHNTAIFLIINTRTRNFLKGRPIFQYLQTKMIGLDIPYHTGVKLLRGRVLWNSGEGLSIQDVYKPSR